MWSSNSDAVIVGIAALISSSYKTLSIPKEKGDHVTCFLPFVQWHVHQDCSNVQHGCQGRLRVL